MFVLGHIDKDECFVFKDLKGKRAKPQHLFYKTKGPNNLLSGPVFKIALWSEVPIFIVS